MLASNYIAIDLETSNDGPEGCPEAHWKANDVLLWGIGTPNQLPLVFDSKEGFINCLDTLTQDENNPVFLIGHNFKFDLKYMLREPELYPILHRKNINIIDTMINEYQISGHAKKFPSLEYTAKSYGLDFDKSLDLDAMLSAGITMRDIDRDDLAEYLLEDVSILFDIIDKMPTTWEHNYLLELAKMELNGLPIDEEMLDDKMEIAYDVICTAHRAAVTILKTELEWSNGDPLRDEDFTKKSNPVKPFAPRTLSYMLTGEPQSGICKRGKKTLKFKRSSGPLLTHAQVTKIWNKKPTHLGYPMPEDKVEEVIKQTGGAYAYTYVNSVMQFRKNNKLYNTYYAPWKGVIQHDKWHGQKTIHPKYNTAATATGRLSSSNPNGQNIPPEAKELVCVNDPHNDLYELDFKQLEIVALAALSLDSNLIGVLNSGSDIHYETGKVVYGWTDPSDQTEELRRLVKGVNFGLLYGGGAATISHQTGAPKKVVKELIDAFYDRFPEVAEWQREFFVEVTDNMESAGFENGEYKYKSYVELPSELGGRRFCFTEKKSPPWLKRKHGKSFSFAPTETKNYPVQGFAGGDLVMYALEQFRAYDQALTLRATVHDSILIESQMPPRTIKAIADQVALDTTLHFNLPCPLKLEIKHGTHWKE